MRASTSRLSCGGRALDRSARLDVRVEQVARDQDEVDLLREREVDRRHEGRELPLPLRRGPVAEVGVAGPEMHVGGMEQSQHACERPPLCAPRRHVRPGERGAPNCSPLACANGRVIIVTGRLARLRPADGSDPRIRGILRPNSPGAPRPGTPDGTMGRAAPAPAASALPSKSSGAPDDTSPRAPEAPVTYVDRTLNCVDCGSEFIHSADDQQYYSEKGFASDPKRCVSCRASRRAARDTGYTASDLGGPRGYERGGTDSRVLRRPVLRVRQPGAGARSARAWIARSTAPTASARPTPTELVRARAAGSAPLGESSGASSASCQTSPHGARGRSGLDLLGSERPVGPRIHPGASVGRDESRRRCGSSRPRRRRLQARPVLPMATSGRNSRAGLLQPTGIRPGAGARRRADRGRRAVATRSRIDFARMTIRQRGTLGRGDARVGDRLPRRIVRVPRAPAHRPGAAEHAPGSARGADLRHLRVPGDPRGVPRARRRARGLLRAAADLRDRADRVRADLGAGAGWPRTSSCSCSARLLQGLAGALLVPSSLSIITHTFEGAAPGAGVRAVGGGDGRARHARAADRRHPRRDRGLALAVPDQRAARHPRRCGSCRRYMDESRERGGVAALRLAAARSSRCRGRWARLRRDPRPAEPVARARSRSSALAIGRDRPRRLPDAHGAPRASARAAEPVPDPRRSARSTSRRC